MRIIKFRIWDKEKKEMSLNMDIYMMAGYLTGIHPHLGHEEFMQFTGLLDRHGKEIFEGDIVYLAGYGDYQVKFPFTELYEAAQENDIGEIKGNVYENPELLKDNTKGKE